MSNDTLICKSVLYNDMNQINKIENCEHDWEIIDVDQYDDYNDIYYYKCPHCGAEETSIEEIEREVEENESM